MATSAKHGMFHIAHPHYSTASLKQYAANAFSRLARARKATNDAKILMSYDDRQLADIGITRSEINAVVYGRHELKRFY